MNERSRELRDKALKGGTRYLAKLREQGPFAPIFKPLLRNQPPTDMFLRPQAES